MGKRCLAETVSFTILSAVFLVEWTCKSLASSQATRCLTTGVDKPAFESALGDSGMKDHRVRVSIEAWDFCNNVGRDSLGLPSPRQADCADIWCPSGTGPCTVFQHVKLQDNMLKAGDVFPQAAFKDSADPDQYAVEKELYLASLCEVRKSQSEAWQFWTVMLKNGNFDLSSGSCPSTSPQSRTIPRPFKRVVSKSSFPCFGTGCMNQPLVYHNWSRPELNCNPRSNRDCLSQKGQALSGGFYGTYDVDSGPVQRQSENKSYFSVTWNKNPSTDSWMFHHVLKVTKKYPWLMLYLRADATSGRSGGYPFETRGMMMKVPESPNFKVTLSLNITKGGGPQSQFYLLDIGGCWKNNGEPCDGDVTTDVTRYSEMIINPETDSWCGPSDYAQCPPYHVLLNGTKIYRNDTANFPYTAYHLYCVPPNAKFAEHPFRYCDPYSNPEPQELVQLLPHPEWAVHGYPATKGEGWINDPRTWQLDVGALSSRLYFYQDPGTPPARRMWPSVDVGTEIFISEQKQTAEWTVSDFDVLIKS
eukprot:c13029_g1_i1 orf=248-1840(+)